MVEISGFHPNCGRAASVSATEGEADQLRDFSKSPVSKSSLRRAINSLSADAEMKAFLKTVSEVTVKIGKTVLFVGRKLVEAILAGLGRYPNTAAGLVVGGVLGALVSSIPFIGWLLGWITPVLMAIGGGLGFLEDLKDARARRELKALSETLREPFRKDRP
jgi:hypothetical protein